MVALSTKFFRTEALETLLGNLSKAMYCWDKKLKLVLINYFSKMVD